MTPERRAEIAKKAATKRWSKQALKNMELFLAAFSLFNLRL